MLLLRPQQLYEYDVFAKSRLYSTLLMFVLSPITDWENIIDVNSSVAECLIYCNNVCEVLTASLLTRAFIIKAFMISIKAIPLVEVSYSKFHYQLLCVAQ